MNNRRDVANIGYGGLFPRDGNLEANTDYWFVDPSTKWCTSGTPPTDEVLKDLDSTLKVVKKAYGTDFEFLPETIDRIHFNNVLNADIPAVGIERLMQALKPAGELLVGASVTPWQFDHERCIESARKFGYGAELLFYSDKDLSKEDRQRKDEFEKLTLGSRIFNTGSYVVRISKQGKEND